MPRVLFLCTHNAARSQMAESAALYTGGDLWSWRNAKERFMVRSDHEEGPKV